MAQSCDRIVAGLRAEGVAVDILHFTRHLAAPRVEQNHGGRYIGYPLGDDPSHGLNLVWNMIEADPLSVELTHVVAFGGVVPMMAAPQFAAWLGVPLVTLFRGNDFDTGIFSMRRAESVRFAIERSAAVCAVSRDKQRRIAALYPHARVEWIANGIDLEEWTVLPSDRARAAAWRAANVAPGRRVLGMIGQLKLKKGGVFMLHELLASEHADRFHLLLVGDLDEGFTELLQANADRLAFTHVPFADRFELLAHYQACDLVAIPSFYDGLPNVLLEAAALGLPLLASTAGGMGDLLSDGQHGFLFAPGDAHGCRRAIDRAARAGDSVLAAMGRASAALIRDAYDHRTEARAYRDLFRDLVHANAVNDSAACDSAAGVPVPGERPAHTSSQTEQ